MPKFLLPPGRIDQRANRLRIRLQRLHRQYEAGEKTKRTILVQGEAYIKDSYRDAHDYLNKYTKRKGLDHPDFDRDPEQNQALVDAIKGWQDIVSDM